jgi:competence protein ComEA
MYMNITGRQFDGAIVIVVMTVIIYIISCYFPLFQPRKFHIPFGDKTYGPIIVEIIGDHEHNGIYHVGEKAKVSDLLIAAGVRNLEGFDKKNINTTLSSGKSVFIESGKQINITEMNNAKKLACNIPIDINKASLDDLIMIPGIGEKTAWQIIQLRKKYGGFKIIDDLMSIHGIKEKKITKLKGYFTIDQIS